MKNAVIGGWQVNGIYTWQHGFPITITAADVGGLNDTFGTNRADLVGDPNAGERTREPMVQHRRPSLSRRPGRSATSDGIPNAGRA